MDIPNAYLVGTLQGGKPRRARRNFGYIDSPRVNTVSEAERRKWNGMPPTKIERERLSWRAKDVKF